MKQHTHIRAPRRDPRGVFTAEAQSAQRSLIWFLAHSLRPPRLCGPKRHSDRRGVTRYSIVVLLPFLLAFTTTGGLVKEGNRALEEGDAKAALDAYGHALERAPGAPEILFDSGLAKSAGGDPAAARESFLAALAGGGEELRGAIEYNVGNTYFAEKNYEAAAKAYRAALAVNPDDQDAKANLELTLRRIAEQKEKQQQQEQKQPQDQKQQGQQDQQPQKPDQEQSEKHDQPPKDDQQQGDSQQPSPGQKAGEPKPEQSPQTNDQSEQQQQARDREQQDDHNNGQQQQAKPSPQGEPPNKDGGAGQGATAATQMDAQQVDQLLDALQSQEEQLQHQVRARLVPVAPRKLEQDW